MFVEAAATLCEQALHFRIADLLKIAIPFADGEEQLRNREANQIIYFPS